MKNLHHFVLALSAALTLISTNVFAQEQCSDQASCWPEGSAMRTAYELRDYLDGANKKLEKKHQELVQLVSTPTSDGMGPDGRLLSALSSQQEAWAKYRSSECELVGALTGAGGAWPTTHALRCEANHTDRRIRTIQSAIKCVTKKLKENQAFDQSACLQQLAPLTNTSKK